MSVSKVQVVMHRVRRNSLHVYVFGVELPASTIVSLRFGTVRIPSLVTDLLRRDINSYKPVLNIFVPLTRFCGPQYNCDTR